MTGEVIKQFLVGLGFGVDDKSLSKFNKSIKEASVRVTALYATIKAAAAGIFWSISKISEGFEQMGYEYRIIAPAINKTLVLRNELLKAYRAAGVNITQVIQQSVKFNMALAKTQFAFKAIFGSVAAKFFPMLTKQMDIFRSKIYANMPKIQASLEKFVNFVFKAFEATVILGERIFRILQRVYDFFYSLHKQTDGWSTIILAVVAAWKLLNLSFLATPLGMIIAGLVALIALWDDFQVWKEGGKSMFDWSSFVPVIDAMSMALKRVLSYFEQVAEVIAHVAFALVSLFSGDFDSFWEHIKGGLMSMLGLFGKLWDIIKSLFSVGKEIGKWAFGLFSGGDAANALKNVTALQGATPGQPGIGNVNNQNQTNMNVQQQTSINVTGSADANAIGKHVAGEQGRVNMDMVRNMKGATR